MTEQKNPQRLKSNNEDMDKPLIKEFSYNVPIDEVWQALTETEKMKVWYFPQLKEFEPKIGFEFQFEDSGDQYRKKWVVTEIDKPKTFAHNWSYKGYKGESEVTFELFPIDNGTKIRVTHTGIKSFPDDPHFKKESFEWGWGNLLGKSLNTLLEKK